MDAYYGPPEWKNEAQAAKLDLSTIGDARGPSPARPQGRGSRDTGDARRRIEELRQLRRSTSSASSRRSRRACGCSKGERLSFDEESKALYDAVAPTYPGIALPGDPRSAREALSRAADRSSSATTRSGARSSFRASKLDAVFQARDRRLPRAHARSTCTLPAGRALHRRVRHQQVVERLQLVSGRLPQPDPGQHRPADLHRPRDRSRLPRGLPRASRLQRAAREAPGQGSRLDRVHRLSAVLAAVADRRGHRELRHRGRLSRRRSASAFEQATLFPLAGLDPARARASTTRCRRWSISCRTPATRRRGDTSTARSTRRRRAAWLERYALMPHDRARAARPVLRPVPQLRDQLQPRQGPGAALHRVARRHGRQSGEALGGIRTLLSSPRLPSGLK